jgi:hypothetical protein
MAEVGPHFGVIAEKQAAGVMAIAGVGATY